MKEHDVDGLDFTVGAPSGGDSGKYAKLDENDIYDAVLLNCTREIITFNNEEKPVIRYNFELQDEEYAYEEDGHTVLRVVQGTSSPTCNHKSKLYKWYCAILGKEEVEVGEKVSLSTLFGMPCRIKIKNKKGKKPRDDGSFTYFAQVDVVMSAKKSKAKKKKEVEVEDDEVEEKVAKVKKSAKKATSKNKKAEPVEEVEPEPKAKSKESDEFSDIDDIFDI